MAVIDSRDAMINAANARGSYNVLMMTRATTTTTAANTTSGYITGKMLERTLTLPTITSPSTEVYCTYCRMIYSVASVSLLCGKIVTLGSINMSTGTFTSGSSMPTSTIAGTSTVTAATHVFGVVTTAVTATTPTVTVTYTDQDGNGSQTATLVLPTSPAQYTLFSLYPHLATGDTGVRSISNITKSAGSAGVITFYGVLELGRSTHNASTGIFTWEPVMGMTKPKYPLSGGDTIGFFSFGNTGGADLIAALSFTPN